MGIMEKLSDMRRKNLDEDWRETAREYNKAKKVQDFHEARQKSLNYNLQTKYGDWDVKISFENSYGDSDIRVSVENEDEYVGSRWFKNGKDLKAYLFDGGLSTAVFKHVREKLARELNSNSVTPEKMREAMAKAQKRIDALQNAIDLKIDEEDIDSKLHRYKIYTNAMKSRSSNRYNLRSKAAREFQKERKLEVGDVVYGNANTDLRSGKAYVIKEIKSVSWTKDPIYVLEPENGRGRTYEERGKNLYRSSGEIDQAIENPDDPKYDKGFDQQQYMMDRYSADRQFDEAVELLNDCGMIVESVATAEDEETILAKYSKYNKLDDLEFLLRRDTNSEPEVTFGRRNKIVWIQTAPFTLVGTYRFDDEAGEYEVKLNSVKF